LPAILSTRKKMTQQEHNFQMDYIEFPATEIEATKRFYSAVFGWSFTDYGANYTSFFDGRLGGGFTTGAKTAKGGVLVVLYAAALEETRGKVMQAGGTITAEIFEFPGGRRFHFADPNGNELAVWSE
jgi:uncharacterized protein